MPKDVNLGHFVREHIRSVWTLELLLLLKRDPERCWPPADLVRELRASHALVSDNLKRLEASGLTLRNDAGDYAYAPANAVLAGLADALQDAYRERPVSVINMIARPADPLQSLADAFKFRGEDK